MKFEVLITIETELLKEFLDSYICQIHFSDMSNSTKELEYEELEYFLANNPQIEFSIVELIKIIEERQEKNSN